MHTSLKQWTSVDGCLTVGGVRLDELARRIGRTPFYAYDRARITERIAFVRKHMPPRAQLNFAVKANPMPALVRQMASLVDGFDVASAGELDVVLQANVPARTISFAGPGKSRAELARAAAAGVLVNVESLREIRVLGQIGQETGNTARVAVRVNPDFELKSSGMKMSGGPTPFGIDSEMVPEALHAIAAAGLQFEGFHIFAGSQNLNAAAICEAHTRALELVLKLTDDAPAPVRIVNIGGGLGIPYFPADVGLDLAPIAANLADIDETLRRNLPGAVIVIELGRYLVGEAGVYVCRVVDRKVSRGRVFLVTDGGMHHHLAASGNFGQVVRKNFPVVIGNRMDDPPTETVSVVGPLCTPLDLLADRLEVPEAREGDLVAIFQSGAYGLTASPTAFLSHPPPAEVLV